MGIWIFFILSQMILKAGGLEISFGENINVASDRKTLFPRSHKIRNQRDTDQQTEEREAAEKECLLA